MTSQRQKHFVRLANTTPDNGGAQNVGNRAADTQERHAGFRKSSIEIRDAV